MSVRFSECFSHHLKSKCRGSICLWTTYRRAQGVKHVHQPLFRSVLAQGLRRCPDPVIIIHYLGEGPDTSVDGIAEEHSNFFVSPVVAFSGVYIHVGFGQWLLMVCDVASSDHNTELRCDEAVGSLRKLITVDLFRERALLNDAI